MLTSPDPSRPGVELIGGDMLMWSDFDPGSHHDDLSRMPGSSALWRKLLVESLRGIRGRVLLVGPEAAKCLDFLPGHLTVDVIVRSRTDAGLVSSGYPGTRVWCGSPTRFDPPTRYDAVVALDDATGLLTPDDEPVTSPDLVGMLGSWVAPSGVFICRAVNRVGMDALLSERQRSPWGVAVDGISLHEVTQLYPDASLIALAGSPPEILAGAHAAADPRLRGIISIGMSGALRAADEAVVRDPLAVVPAVVESGDLLRLAPAWLIIDGVALQPQLVMNADAAISDLWSVTDSPPVSPEPQPERDGALPEEEEEESSRPASPPFPGQEWRRWFVLTTDGQLNITSDAQNSTSLGPLWRTGQQEIELSDATHSLEGAWRAAAAEGQLEPLRRLVREWSSWVDQLPEESAWFAVPHNIVVENGRLNLLDRTCRWIGPPDSEAAKILSLRRFAKRLLETGASHPWPAHVSLDAVTESLALMAGVDWSVERLTAAVTVGERIRVLTTTGDETSIGDAVQRSLLAGVQHQLSLGSVFARTTQQRLLNQLGNEANATQIQLEWYQRHVRRRDGQLEGLERQLASIENSVPYKIARGMTWPGRVVIRAVKGLVKRALPPSAWRRLISLAKKRLH